MDIVRLLVIICVVGLVVYLIEAFTPLDTTFKRLIQGVALVGCLLLTLRWFGIF